MFTPEARGYATLRLRDSSLVTANGPLPRAVRHLYSRPVALDSPPVRVPSRPASLAAALLSALLSALLAAPVALADNGTGLAGPTTDKTVTFFCFGVIAFFAITVIVLSLIQERLERRKERRRYDLERYG
jgi:putative copper export protein